MLAEPNDFPRKCVPELLHRLETLHSSQTIGQLMVSCAGALQPFFDADHFSVGLCDPQRNRVVAIGRPADWAFIKVADRYKDIADQSPLFQYWVKTKDHDRILRRSDCCEESDFRRTALYNEVCRPLQLNQQIGTWLRPGKGAHLEIGFYRTGRTNFTISDIRRLHAIRDHVFRAYMNVLERQRYTRASPVDDLPGDAFLLQATSMSSKVDGSAEREESCSLTPREREVLRWLTEGKTNAEIGVILGTSWRTVQKQVESIFKKLNVETRTTAAMRAIELRLV